MSRHAKHLLLTSAFVLGSTLAGSVGSVFADDLGPAAAAPSTTVAPLSLGGSSAAATTAAPAAGVRAPTSTLAPGSPATAALAKARTLIAAKDFAAAIAALQEADKLQPNNADVQNLLGFSSRKLGKLDAALAYYASALKIDPKHRGAHEYLGETYLMLNQPTKAKVELASLLTICGVSCEEYLDLKKAVAAYKPTKTTKKK